MFSDLVIIVIFILGISFICSFEAIKMIKRRYKKSRSQDK